MFVKEATQRIFACAASPSVAILESRSYIFTIQVGGIRVPKSVLIIGSLLIAAVVVAFFFRPGASSTGSSGALSSKIEPKWTYETHEQIAGALALADNGTIYAAGQIGNVYALNPDGTLSVEIQKRPGPGFAGDRTGRRDLRDDDQWERLGHQCERHAAMAGEHRHGCELQPIRGRDRSEPRITHPAAMASSLFRSIRARNDGRQ